MSQPLNAQLCRIVAPEKLADRFIASGVIKAPEGWSIASQVILVYVFEITRPWFPSSSVIPSVNAILADQYAQLKPDESLGDQFELLLRAVNQQLNALSEQGETDWIGNLNGIIMAIGGEELHFSQTGSAPAYLLQNNRIRQITDDAGEHEPHPLKTFSNLASGALKPGDQILLANHDLYREISLDALRRIVSRFTPFQASQSIAKELKRAKNPAVSSLIIRILPEAEQPADEPAEILLEDEMQSAAKKAGKKLSPIMAALGRFGRSAGKAGMGVAQQTGSALKNTVAPAAVELLKKGAEGAKGISEKVADKLVSAPKEPEGETAAPAPVPVATPVVERILPRPTLPPADAVATTTEAVAAPVQAPATFSPAVWLADMRNRKLAALVAAALLITTVIGIALARQKPVASPQVQNQNAQLIQQAQALSAKAAPTAQDIAAAQADLDALQSPTTEQAATAKTLNATLTVQSDNLTGTTRLSAQATYAFPAQSSGVIAGLPYFYGFGSSGLLRAGKGEASSVQATVVVPGAGDSIVSMAESGDSSATAYALTLQDKVYRVLQAGGDPSLQPVQPGAGDSFAKGDVIGTYNGNVYILDSVTGLLWKYPSTGASFAKGVSVIDKSKYDISGSVSLAIDGSIYVLKKDGRLMKFTSGVQNADFSLSGTTAPWIQPRQVITSQGMDGIYVLDAGMSTGTRSSARVIQFTKQGAFVRQYAFPEGFTKVQGFDIDEKNKTLWVLNGGDISEFAIQ